MENENNSLELEDLKLDADNKEFMTALNYAVNTNKTIYLTGKAGTGKTTFLKYLKKVSKKNMVVLAPTGVAALNASGETIHSFFKIQPSVYLPEDARLKTDRELDDPSKKSIFKYLRYDKAKVEMIQNLDAIVIDEVSMVRCDLMDVIDKILRVYRNSMRPFGGVQLILVGDAYQLPPIVKKDEQEILKGNYDGMFFFHSKVMKRLIDERAIVYVELQKIYRQKDDKFIEVLNRVRVNQMLDSDFILFDSKMSKDKQFSDKTNHIILTTTNVKVKYINDKRLSALMTESKVYDAVVSGAFPEKDRPTDTSLELKVGAQIIFVRNDKEKRYHNGKLGVVKYMGDESLVVETETKNGGKMNVEVFRETWKNVAYNWSQATNVIEEHVIGTFVQFPVKLAWAITVHKSQGMTFERVMADIGNSFEMGQVYVALSRCTSLDGLMLSSKIKPKSIITDPQVLEFSEKMSKLCAPDDMLMNETEQVDETTKLYDELRDLREYVKELEYYKSQQVELYGYDTVSSLRKKLTSKENEYQDEIARLNVKNRELKEKIKKLENKEAAKSAKKTKAELKKEAQEEKERQAKQRHDEELLRKDIEEKLRPQLRKDIEKELTPRLRREIEEEYKAEYKRRSEKIMSDLKSQMENDSVSEYETNLELKDARINALQELLRMRDEQIEKMETKEKEALAAKESVKQDTIQEKKSSGGLFSFFRKMFGSNRK